jgi:hypothetical protein
MIRFKAAVVVAFAVFSGTACGNPSVRADDPKGLSALIQANKAYQSGDLAEARRLVDLALQSDADKELTARAMLLRAQLQEQDGKLTRALSDYSGALWLQTLPASEKAKATEGKERVMAAMGLNKSQPQQAQAQAQPQATQTASAGGESQSGGLFGMLGGIFQGEQKATASAPAASAWTATAAPSPASASAAPVRTASARADSEGEAKPKAAAAKPKAKAETASAAKRAEPEARLEKASTAPDGDGSGYFIELAQSASSASAKDQAVSLKSKLSDILVSRDLIVQQAGSSYRVVAGPYKARNAASALCSAMSKRGVNCKITEG